ncbi:MAG: AAA family ATPase, partial [Simkaniaceae bacterium]|nr:AAA family ATPase [Simkaniaceae bacterium]
LSAETKTMRKPIFLVGPTRSGKTALVQGLGQAIARGNVPDQLKGKTVCLINSAKIAGSSYSWSETRSMSMPPLDRLFADLEGKEEDVILFFDEIQAAKVGKGTVTTANLLQTLKSKSDGGQLNLMIATTDKEYREQMAHDIAFFGRFHTIFVNELKGPALISFLLERYRKLPLSRAAIEKAVELLSKDETRTTAFPRAAIQLLDYVASELNFSGDPEMHKQLEELNSEKSLAERILKTQIARDPTLSDMTQLERIQRLTGLIHTLETSLSQKRNDFDYLWQLKNRVIALQDSLFDLSEKAIQEKNTAQKTKLIGQMILTHQVALPALRRILRQEKFKYEVTYESLFVEEISSETVEHLFHHMREQRLKALPGKSSQDSIGTSVELADDDLP